MQQKNSTESLRYWKAKIAPNQQIQRELIAHGAANKFVKISLMSQLEIRISTGQLGRPVTAPAGLTTTDEFADFPAFAEKANDTEFNSDKEKASRKMMSSAKGSANLGAVVGPRSAALRRQDTLTKWQNRGKEDKKDHEIKFRDDASRPQSASDRRKEFKNMLTTSYKFVEDGLLSKTISHQINMESRDPKSIYLALGKSFSSSVDFTLCSDAYNTRQVLEMRDKERNEQKMLGMAIILDPSVVTSGRQVVLKLRYRQNPRYERTHTASNMPAARSGLARSGSMGARPNSTGGLRKKFASSKGEKGSRTKNLGALTGGKDREKGGVVEVSYRINSSRKYRYDLKLKTDNRVESPPEVNGRPMFLPGWEGTMPLFLPTNHVVCQVLSTADNIYDDGSVDSPREDNEVSDSLPGIIGRPPKSSLFGEGVRVPGFAFSCESPAVAVRMLQKVSNDTTKAKVANLIVQGNLPALHVAALHGNIDAMQELMQNGADVNLLSSKPTVTTALHEAVMGGQVEAIKFLLEMGADARQVDLDGNSPLHLAVIQDDIECMSPFYSCDGSVKILQAVNKKGCTAYDLAKSNSTRLSVEKGMKRNHIVVKRREKLV
jgi:hypothetical protein